MNEAENEKRLWEKGVAGTYLSIPDDGTVECVIKNTYIKEVEKEFQGKKSLRVEFGGEVIEENGVECEKKYATTSRLLLIEFRRLLEDKPKENRYRLELTKRGKLNQATYFVKLLEEMDAPTKLLPKEESK